MSEVKHTSVTYIPVKNLSVVWVQAQRPYNQRWAKEIADNLDPDKFDPIIVTKPNGQGVYHIIEGQHRRHALEMYAAKTSATGKGGDEMAPCRVVAEADPARAAEIWLGVNQGRRRVGPIIGFQVSVVAGREPEVTINQLISVNGYRVSSEKRHNQVMAVSALKTVFERHGKMTLNSVLRVLRLMWNGDPHAVSAEMLRGFGIFLHEFGPHVDNKRMVKIAERWSPYRLKMAAVARRQGSQERLDEAVSELVLREYNRGMKEGQRLRHKG